MSGTTPIVFPPSPSQGQVFSAGGVNWMFDTQRWRNANTQGAFQPVAGPLMVRGVTDGSDAAAGQVGEYVSSTNTSANWVQGGIYNVLCTLPLPSGDWDVSARAQHSGTGISNTQIAIQAGASFSGTPDMNLNPGTAAVGNPINTIGPKRFSSASAQTISLFMAVQGSGAAATANGWMWARRVR